jgi:hypothetical protein
MKRNKRILAAAGVLIVLAAVSITLLLLNREGKTEDTGKSQTPIKPTTSSSSALPTYPPPNAEQFANILTGDDKAAQAAILLPEFRDAEWSAGDVVPDGTTLTIDQESFVSSGVYGAFEAKIEALSGVENFVIHLQNHDGQWLIWTFEEV